jgi:hypothetical protein
VAGRYDKDRPRPGGHRDQHLQALLNRDEVVQACT